MGLMVPWQNLREGRVPSVDDFQMVADEVLRTAAAHPRIFKSLTINGSVARGDLTPRSDLDMIAVGYDARMRQAHQIMRELNRMAAQHGVTFDVILWRSSDALHGRHKYGPSYALTFQDLPDEYTVGRPLRDCFRFAPAASVEDEMVGKITRKWRSTMTRSQHFERSCFGPDRVEEWIKRCWKAVVRPMQVHITLGRGMLWWRDGYLARDGKEEVVRQFLSEPSFAPFRDSYLHLLEIDEQYDHLLVRAREGKVHRGRYLHRVSGLLRQNFEVSLDLLGSATAFMRADALQQAA